MTNSPGHLWRDKWIALSGPLSLRVISHATRVAEPAATSRELPSDTWGVPRVFVPSQSEQVPRSSEMGLVGRACGYCARTSWRYMGRITGLCTKPSLTSTTMMHGLRWGLLRWGLSTESTAVARELPGDTWGVPLGSRLISHLTLLAFTSKSGGRV